MPENERGRGGLLDRKSEIIKTRDRIESANASKYGKYSIKGLDNLRGGKFITVHGGYDPVYATEDPDRVVPLDALRELEREGVVGEVYNYYYSTTGNTTAVSSATKFATEIAQDLLSNQIQAVILTSNWGTCTRCGATMAKTIESFGIPTAHVCSIVPISLSVGANRIIPATAIPYPTGNPKVSENDEYSIRKAIVTSALKALSTRIESQTVFEA